jgi:hypothetical protein
VILDLRFTDEAWWLEVVQCDNADSGRAASAAHLTRCPWSETAALDLVQETLIFAWHMAKADWRAARLLFGVPPTVADSIAALTPRQVLFVARNHCDVLRLRWHDQSDLWAALLCAGRNEDHAAVLDIHLHAKLLLAGELIPLCH